MPIHAPFWGTFPPNDITHRPNPKPTILGLNHVIWAINRENRLRGSSWALVREKRTGQDREKVTKGLYFTYLWRSPHWCDVYEHLCSGWCSRRNHVRQVSKRNFKGLRFYRGRIFHFSNWFWMGLTTVQRYCAACDICDPLQCVKSFNYMYCLRVLFLEKRCHWLKRDTAAWRVACGVHVPHITLLLDV